MTVIAGSCGSCDSDRLAQSLAVDSHDAERTIDALIAVGHASRRSAAVDGAATVSLTLSGELLLRRAGQTVERVLHAQLDPALRPRDQEMLRESLRTLRRRWDLSR
jgi:DNA-binding MarR family transcriptional regulator